MVSWRVRYRRVGVTLVGAAVAALILPGGRPVAATVPVPAGGETVGVATDPWGSNFMLFYRQAGTGHLINMNVAGSGFEDLGGDVTGGAAGTSVVPNEGYFYVLVRDRSGAVHYQRDYTGGSSWEGWQSLGGLIVGTPTASCVRTGPPVVWVRGTNNSLYLRVLAPNHGWQRLGGQLTSDPAAIPTVMGVCPPIADVFMLGPNHAITEWIGGRFQEITGMTDVAPAAVRLSDGRTWLFVRGRGNNALYYRGRPAGSTAWGNWIKLGGTLTSAPSVTVFRGQPVVVVQGTSNRLYRGQFQHNNWHWTAIA